MLLQDVSSTSETLVSKKKKQNSVISVTIVSKQQPFFERKYQIKSLKQFPFSLTIVAASRGAVSLCANTTNMGSCWSGERGKHSTLLPVHAAWSVARLAVNSFPNKSSATGSEKDDDRDPDGRVK